MNTTPTLTAIMQEALKQNRFWWMPGANVAEAFTGKCGHASEILAEMVGGTLVHGWFRGEITEQMDNWNADHTKHLHHWVVLHDKILDPTFFQFTGSRPRLAVFEVSDPRFEFVGHGCAVSIEG